MGLGFILVIVALFIYGIYLYNELIQNRIHVQEGWSGVDVQLKRRYDLVPNLVEVVKGYTKHERGVLEEVTALRSQASQAQNIKDRQALENNLTAGLRTIFALAEAYPDLKANQSFLELQKNLIAVEDEIQLSRRYYNGTVRNYNIKVQSVPSNILAQAFRFEKADFFEIKTVTEREAPNVQLS